MIFRCFSLSAVRFLEGRGGWGWSVCNQDQRLPRWPAMWGAGKAGGLVPGDPADGHCPRFHTG